MLRHNHPQTISGETSPVVTKLGSIDAFRGIAILLVLIVHISQFIVPTSIKMQHLMSAGARGVQLFYVLSAFSLIYGYYVRLEKDRFVLRDYFIRRLFRIAPLFWIASCFYLWYGQSNFYAPHGVGVLQIITSFLFINAWLPTTISAIIPVGWSVAIEMMFYLLLPIIFKYIRDLRSACFWFACSLVFAAIWGHAAVKFFNWYLPAEWLQVNFNFAWILSLPAQLPVFMTGILFYFVYRAMRQIEDDETRESLGLAFIITGVIICLSIVKFTIGDHRISEFVSYAFIWGLVLTGSLVRPMNIFDNRLFRYFGKISYSAYLWHLPLLQAIEIFCNQHHYIKPQGNWFFFTAFPILAAIISIVSLFSYRLIEMPGIRLGEKLITKLKYKNTLN
jgi:peptidoglycan/LPS O-acetylase OafA/YrhL